MRVRKVGSEWAMSVGGMAKNGIKQQLMVCKNPGFHFRKGVTGVFRT